MLKGRHFKARALYVSSNDPIIASMPGRYATALFELARDAGDLDRVGGELSAFETMLDESADLTRLVRSPVFSANDLERR